MNYRSFPSRILLTLVSYMALLQTPACAQTPPLPTFDDRIVLVLATKPNDSISYGAGFIVTPLGTFLTAAHVISNIKTQTLYEDFRARLTIGDSLVTVSANLVHSFAIDTPSFDLALFQLDTLGSPPPAFRQFILGDVPKKGTQVVVAGYPKIYGLLPHAPVYRSGIVATHWKVGGAPTVILDLTPLSGFSGGPVIDLSVANATVFAVVRGYAAGEAADLTDAYVIPAAAVQSALKDYNAKNREPSPETQVDSPKR